jgi:serine protease Do
MYRLKSSLNLVVSSLLFLTLIPTAQAFDREKLLGSFFSIVMIRGHNSDGSLAYGSGVIVEPTKVLTNCHIFRQTKEPWISRGEDTFPINNVQADRYHDLCLVTSESLPFPAAQIGSVNTMKKGAEIVAIGHSSASPAPITSIGTIKSIYPYDKGNVIRSTARFAMGASGSGLFDGDGHLIGINTFKTPGRNAYFYALPVEWLAELKTKPVETQFPIEGKTFWEEDDANKPLFMQMAEPEIQEDWVKLSGVAEKWVKAEPNNSEAWYELGFAQEHLKLKTEAEQSYRHAIMLNSQNLDALFRVGVLASEKGNNSEVDAIKVSIAELNAETAEEFKQAISCKDAC